MLKPDSVSIDDYYKDIPFKKLREGSSYVVRSYYGGVAAMYGYYKVSMRNNDVYFESSNQSEHILSEEEVASLEMHEAYLLGLVHFKKGATFGIVSHTIIQNNDTLKIYVDRWQDCHKFYFKIYKPEYDLLE